MNSDPCTVCGGTDVNLVDGFYYCTECGTQDMTIRETIVEGATLIDGSLAVGKKKKINLKKPKLHMSKEWDKWHAYNFILCGLVDELITLGAKPSFKSKVLWIWTRYIKKYHIRKEYEMNSSRKQNTLINDIDDDLSDDSFFKDDKDNEGKRTKSHKSGIRSMTYQLLYSILYVGLNLDKSDILLSHILRYIKEGRLSYHNLVKYVPSEINASKIPQWSEFMLSRIIMFTSFSLLRTSYWLIKNLELGTPVIPNLTDIVNMQVKELCLPRDIKSLVFSLMDFLPIKRNHYLDFEHLKMLPDFETIVMSYVLLALKLCFGLDDEYDIKLSDAVERINKQECHLKCYRVGISETTDRLFSLREWFMFLEFRKIILCQLYQPMASKHDFNEDNFLVTELLKDQVKQEQIKRVADQLSFELLNTIPQKLPFTIIPKEDFPVSLTPLTTYTEFVLPRIKDSHMRLLLSEDFSKYSIKYACINLFLQNSDGDNIVKGVTENNKTFNPLIVGLYSDKLIEKQTMIYVRNADNDNWVQDFLDKNKKLENTRVKKKSNFRDFVSEWSSDSDDDLPLSHIKTKKYEVDEKDVIIGVEPMKLQSIEELEDGKNIFNDDFDDLKEDVPNESEEMPELVFEFSKSQIDSLNATKDEIDVSDDFGELSRINPPDAFNPFSFNRQEVIKMLILKACQKYKIPIPYKYNNKKPVERKRKLEPSPTPVFAQKRAKKTEYGKHTKIIAAYNALFPEDITVKEHELPTSNDTRENFPPENAIDESDQVGHAESDIDKSAIEENYNNLTLNDTSLPDDDIIGDGQTQEFEFDLDKYVEEDKELMQILDKEIFESKTDKSKAIKSLKEKILDKRKSNSALKNTKSLKVIEKKYEPLIENVNNINVFKYYTRHYNSTIMKNNLLSYTFESDLTENFPKSFKYILMTCANILEVSSYHLYKYFIHLEKVLSKKVKSK